MVLTREGALELHRQMWSDMQKTIGDNPMPWKRVHFKENWINEHFPNAEISNNCFLCEYVGNEDLSCCNCPIKWPNGYCGNYYLVESISKILALPEREIEE